MVILFKPVIPCFREHVSNAYTETKRWIRIRWYYYQWKFISGPVRLGGKNIGWCFPSQPLSLFTGNSSSGLFYCAHVQFTCCWIFWVDVPGGYHLIFFSSYFSGNFRPSMQETETRIPAVSLHNSSSKKIMEIHHHHDQMMKIKKTYNVSYCMLLWWLNFFYKQYLFIYLPFLTVTMIQLPLQTLLIITFIMAIKFCTTDLLIAFLVLPFVSNRVKKVLPCLWKTFRGQ